MSGEDVTLYGFWSSSGTYYLPHLINRKITRQFVKVGCKLEKGTWRVRAALVYKNLSYEEVSINIVEKDQSWINYQKKINPMGFVPAGFVAYYDSQSMNHH